MEPFLAEGDQVVVEPVRYESLVPGQVVTYRFNDKLPTRRLIRVEGDRLVLWAENWPSRRFFATKEEVLGIAVARCRDGNWVSSDDAQWQAAAATALARHRRYLLSSAPKRFLRRILEGLGLLPDPELRRDEPGSAST